MALLAAGAIVAGGILGAAIIYTNRSAADTADRDAPLSDSLTTPRPVTSTQPLQQGQATTANPLPTPPPDQRLPRSDLPVSEPTIHPQALPYATPLASPQRSGSATISQEDSTTAERGGTAGVYSSREVTTKARVTSKPQPQYTEIARQNQVVGTVVLRAVLTADGEVTNIQAVSGLPHGLTERAIEAARQIKFVPATKDGRPVSMYIQLEYNFNLY